MKVTLVSDWGTIVDKMTSFGKDEQAFHYTTDSDEGTKYHKLHFNQMRDVKYNAKGYPVSFYYMAYTITVTY